VKALSGRDFARPSSDMAGHCFASMAVITSTADPGSVVRLSIPIHGNRPLKLGLLRHLAKLAGITDDELA
jgi:hypothetical protein